jgi:hypothetical protein
MPQLKAGRRKPMLDPADAPLAVSANCDAERIVRAVSELNAALDAADDEQRMFGVMMSCENLITAYRTIASLNRVFHLICEDRNRELEWPKHGTA